MRQRTAHHAEEEERSGEKVSSSSSSSPRMRRILIYMRFCRDVLIGVNTNDDCTHRPTEANKRPVICLFGGFFLFPLPPSIRRTHTHILTGSLPYPAPAALSLSFDLSRFTYDSSFIDFSCTAHPFAFSRLPGVVSSVDWFYSTKIRILPHTESIFGF